MFKSKAMKQLEADLAAKQKEAAAINAKADATEDEINKARQDVKNLKNKISMQKELDEGKTFDESGEEVIDRTPVNHPLPAEPNTHKGPFNSFSEQVLAIMKASVKGGTVDPRLSKVVNASGTNETVPSEGGFLVQTDYSNEILKMIYDTGILPKLCREIPLSANSNGIKINGIDETSRADGYRHGGVQGYWVEEAGTVTASKPKWRKIELELKKLMAVYYATDELLSDSTALENELRSAFSDELAFKLDDAIFQGDGSGKPLGIIKAPCLVEQAKESGQAADTVVHENISNMWNRMPARIRANAVWLINQEIEPQLDNMALSMGTAGMLSPYATEYMLKGTLKGRPVLPIEQASALGDKGDIVLAAMNHYLLATKGGVKMDSSMHLKFLEDEMAFRVIFRADGEPDIAAAITPYKATSNRTVSSFVTLAARS